MQKFSLKIATVAFLTVAASTVQAQVAIGGAVTGGTDTRLLFVGSSATLQQDAGLSFGLFNGKKTLTLDGVYRGSATNGDVVLMDGWNNLAFRSTRANAWTDNKATQYFQIGTVNPNTYIGDNVAFTSQFGAQANRMLFTSYTTQISNGHYLTMNPPTGIFEVSDGTAGILNILGTRKAGINNTNPTEALDVTGNLKFSGAFMPNNLAGTAGQVLLSTGAGTAPVWASPSSVNGWSLIGNAATNALNNFIGTTDNADLVFKRNNVKSGLIGADNTAFGYSSFGANTSGYRNVAIGTYSLNVNTTGFDNVGVGVNTLVTNTTGHTNAAFGSLTLVFNTSGISNTATGTQALFYNTTGNYNVATGRGTLQFNTTGSNNLASGLQSMYNNINGENNAAYGAYSLHSNTSGSLNTVIGYNTGRGITTGSYNTIVGANVQNLPGNLSNNIILADGQGNRRINVDATGNVGIGTTNTADVNYKLFVETGIRTRKIKVDIDAWPDYVFKPTYKLPSLNEVEKYLQNNQHLPDVPSAAEAEKNGIDLGINQSILLKKVEELTLYMIDLNKKVEVLAKENAELKKKIIAADK